MKTARHKAHPFSLIRLNVLAIGILVVSSGLAVLALLGVQSSSQQAVHAWRQFADQASAEQRALRAFVTQAGMSGLVDDYHRLAATGDETLIPMVYGRGGAALGALATYPVEGKSDAEKDARSVLQSLVRAYMARVATIAALQRTGRTTEEVEKAAEIDGASAIVALQTLAGATARSMMAEGTPLDSKALILLDIRRLMGLEGLVQNANRYLVSGTAGALDRVRKDIDNVNVAIDRYGRHDLTPQETSALNALKREVARIEQRLVADRAASVTAFDTRPVQAALTDLEKLVYADALAAQQNLQSTLDEVAARAGTIILLVGGGGLILIAGAIWLLAFRIGGRIHGITGAMRDLASGNLDAEIPASGDRDEIGEMSEALTIFRDGLRANAALTTELAESSRLASLGAMVAGMAHELNTPIGNALAVSSSLEEQCKTFKSDLNSERILRSMLEQNVAAIEDASALIQRNLHRAAEQIGSFKQVAVDQTSGRRRQFHLDDVLASVVKSMQPQLKRTPFLLTLGEASGVVMESYPGALSQVVTNLIENAVKHGLAGRPHGRIKVDVRRLGPNFTEVRVSDDGVGIPEDIRSSIFNAFFTTQSGKGGSGLGLHIVKSIVCGPLGGRISVQPAPDGGALFIISLPNVAPAEKNTAQTPERTYYAADQHAA